MNVWMMRVDDAAAVAARTIVFRVGTALHDRQHVAEGAEGMAGGLVRIYPGLGGRVSTAVKVRARGCEQLTRYDGSDQS